MAILDKYVSLLSEEKYAEARTYLKKMISKSSELMVSLPREDYRQVARLKYNALSLFKEFVERKLISGLKGKLSTKSGEALKFVPVELLAEGGIKLVPRQEAIGKYLIFDAIVNAVHDFIKRMESFREKSSAFKSRKDQLRILHEGIKFSYQVLDFADFFVGEEKGIYRGVSYKKHLDINFKGFDGHVRGAVSAHLNVLYYFLGSSYKGEIVRKSRQQEIITLREHEEAYNQYCKPFLEFMETVEPKLLRSPIYSKISQDHWYLVAGVLDLVAKGFVMERHFDKALLAQSALIDSLARVEDLASRRVGTYRILSPKRVVHFEDDLVSSGIFFQQTSKLDYLRYRFSFIKHDLKKDFEKTILELRVLIKESRKLYHSVNEDQTFDEEDNVGFIIQRLENSILEFIFFYLHISDVDLSPDQEKENIEYLAELDNWLDSYVPDVSLSEDEVVYQIPPPPDSSEKKDKELLPPSSVVSEATRTLKRIKKTLPEKPKALKVSEEICWSDKGLKFTYRGESPFPVVKVVNSPFGGVYFATVTDDLSALSKVDEGKVNTFMQEPYISSHRAASGIKFFKPFNHKGKRFVAKIRFPSVDYRLLGYALKSFHSEYEGVVTLLVFSMLVNHKEQDRLFAGVRKRKGRTAMRRG